MKWIMFLVAVVGVIYIKTKMYKPTIEKDKKLDHPERINLRRM